MFSISKDFSWRIREKRARKRISISEAANQIGISRMTLGSIESGEKNEVRKAVFVKLTNWLMQDEVI